MVLKELEGFTFATALDLNVGYYTIRLDPDASNICTIIFPWGNTPTRDFRCALQVLLTFFQSKMLELMEDLEYVQAYLDDLHASLRAALRTISKN
jgi:hypothetical protein